MSVLMRVSMHACMYEFIIMTTGGVGRIVPPRWLCEVLVGAQVDAVLHTSGTSRSEAVSITVPKSATRPQALDIVSLPMYIYLCLSRPNDLAPETEHMLTDV